MIQNVCNLKKCLRKLEINYTNLLSMRKLYKLIWRKYTVCLETSRTSWWRNERRGIWGKLIWNCKNWRISHNIEMKSTPGPRNSGLWVEHKKGKYRNKLKNKPVLLVKRNRKEESLSIKTTKMLDNRKKVLRARTDFLEAEMDIRKANLSERRGNDFGSLLIWHFNFYSHTICIKLEIIIF